MLAFVVFGAEAAVDALGVVADDAVGGGDDPAGRAVVEFEVDPLGVGEILFEVEDVADVGLAPAVDRLIRIADDEQVAVLRREGGDQDVLDAVGVLILVDQDVRVALLIALQQGGRLVEEPDRQDRAGRRSRPRSALRSERSYSL